jgi:hypothetical protein
MTNRAFIILVAVVGLLLAGIVYMHMPRRGQPARLPQSLHGVR